MSLENLIAAAPPPETPYPLFRERWDAIETAVGTALPPDFKRLAEVYGCGTFFDFMGVVVPSAVDRGVEYARWVGSVCRSFRLVEADEPIWPDPQGLFPLGVTDNGDQIFWRPVGDPADWRIVVWDRGECELESFACDLTDFLAGLATGAIAPRGFPDDLHEADPAFRPDAP